MSFKWQAAWKQESACQVLFQPLITKEEPLGVTQLTTGHLKIASSVNG